MSLAILWCLLSGYWYPLLLSMGAGSILLVIYLSYRMQVVDSHSHPSLLFGSMLMFWLKLLLKIFQANLTVAWQIITGQKQQPVLLFLPFPTSWQSDHELNKVIYANAITLTPGTASLEMTEKGLWIHCLQANGADDLQKNGILSILPKKGAPLD